MKPWALYRIGPSGHETLMYECDRRSEALRARDDYLEQARLDGRAETYVVMGDPAEGYYEEWDDAGYCAQCQDVRVKAGMMCGECLSEMAGYYTGEGYDNG